MAKFLDGKAVADEYDEYAVVMPDDEIVETTSRESALNLAKFYRKGIKKHRVFVTDWEDDTEEPGD